jgi:hypothetical protein
VQVQLWDLKAASKDPDGFRSKAAEFGEKVEVAQKVLQEAKVELERREKERAERLACSQKLQTAASTLSNDFYTAKRKIETRGGSDNVKEYELAMCELNSRSAKKQLAQEEELSSWKESVETIVSEMEALSARIKKDVEILIEGRKDAFAKLRERFNTQVSPRPSLAGRPSVGGRSSLTSTPSPAKVKEEEEAPPTAPDAPVKYDPPERKAPSSPEPEPARKEPEPEAVPPALVRTNSVVSVAPLASKVKIIKKELDIDDSVKLKDALIEACDQLGIEPVKGKLPATADLILAELGL